MNEFDKVKHTITNTTSLQTPVQLKGKNKMTKLLANNMINEDKIQHKKQNVETEVVRK